MLNQRHGITLKGSAKIVAKFLYYAINSILYQRGIYASEEFGFEEKYGIKLLVCQRKRIQTFLEQIIKIVEEWLPDRKIDRITVVIMDVVSRKTLERWDFTVENCDDQEQELGASSKPFSTKSFKVIQSEIRTVMRQITSSVSFLPLVRHRATFDVLIYPKPSEYATELPAQWVWKTATDITVANSQLVRMQSFSTGVDKVDTAVVYSVDEV